MRTLIVLLLGLNLVLALMIDGRWLRWPDQRDPERASFQMDAERVRLLAHSPVATSVVPQALPPTLERLCHEWGPFAEAAMAIELDWIRAQLPATPVDALRLEPASSQWLVATQPAATVAAATRRAQELRRRGVQDLYVIQEEGPLKGGISLGLFSTREAAERLLEARRGQGIADARLVERPGPARYWIQVLALADQPLDALATQLTQRQPEAQWRPCPDVTPGSVSP